MTSQNDHALSAAVEHQNAALEALQRDTDATANAVSQLNAARDEHARDQQERAAWIERHARRLTERARAGHSGAPPSAVPSDRALIAEATSRATLEAAEGALKLCQDAENASRAELAAAVAAVRAAATAAVHAEIRTMFEELRALEQRRQELRERLLGAYLAAPRALADADWVRVDTGEGFPAQHMKVGMPLIGVSIYADGPDPRPSRARIDAHAAAWAHRMGELASSASESQPAKAA